MTVLKRLPDWQPRLHLWLHSCRTLQIEPGRHDCCLFGAGGVEAQTGVDIAARWRGRYTTYAGGQRVLRKAGYADHVDLIARSLPEAPPREAMAGDVAVIPTDEGLAVGIVQGTAIYVLAPAGGLGFAPMSAVQRLFKVG